MKLPRIYVAVVSLVVVGIAGGVALRLRPGIIAVTSQPAGATVALDGKVTSHVTPCTLTGVRPGKHEVSCSLNDYHDGTASTDVKAGGSHSVSVELKPVLTTGFLQLESEPGGAAVWVDGSDTGKETPVTLEEVQPGDHTVELRRGGYRTWQQRFTIRAEETTSSSQTLEQLPEYVIACRSDSEGLGWDNIALFAVNLASGSERRLAVVPASSRAYAISPSGSVIAVASDGSRTHQDSIVFVDHRGAIVRTTDIPTLCKARLTWPHWQEPRVMDLDWHPRRSDRLLVSIHCVYASRVTVGGDHYDVIAELRPSTGALRLLTPLKPRRVFRQILESSPSGPVYSFPAFDDTGACYAPDGQHVAFLRNNELYIGNSDLSGARLISQAIETGESPFQPPIRWRSDGKRLLCCKRDEGYIITTEGEINKTIPGLIPGASWTSDGKRIVGYRTGEGTPDQGTLCVFDLETEQWSEVASGFGNPSGQKLACGRLEEPSKEPSKLTVVSKVGQAKVYLNGQLTGKLTPHTFILDPGVYAVEIRTVDGQRSGKGSVTVLPGGVQTFTFN